MKKIFYFAAALAVILPSACTKDIVSQENEAQEKSGVRVVMNATAGDPVSKMILNGSQFEWENGDQIRFRYTGATYDETTPYGVLTATSTGSVVTFEGELTGINMSTATQVNNMYVFSSADGQFTGTSTYYKDIPSEQTGLLSDLKKYAFWSVWVTKGMQKFTETDSNGLPVELEIDATLLPKFSIIKLNVPASLALTSIKLEAESDIAGGITINAARNPNYSSGTSAHLSRSNGVKAITVSNGNEIISGDVYIVVAPDAYDPNAAVTSTSFDKYCCSTESLKFTFVNSNGEMTYSRSLTDPIHCGELKDLGSLPANMMTPVVEAGSLCMTDATSLTIGVANPNSDCKYYYEIGATKDACATPTTASAEFDPATGFAPDVTGNFDRYFIKVLAHTDDPAYRDAVMTASLRNWKFYQGCPVDEVLSQMESGAKLPAVGDTEMTSHGLELRRNTLKATDPVNYDIGPYESNSSRIAYTTARVQINAITEYDSDAWISFFVDRNTSVKVGSQRGYRLYYNNSQSTDSYWKTSVTSEAAISEKINICLHLSEIFKDNGIKAGDKFGLRGDGKHVFYGMAILEVL